MSGVLLSCCNTGHRGGPFFLAFCHDRANELSWIKLDDIGVDFNRASGATGLFYEQDRCFVAIQGLHDPAIVLEFDRDFRFKTLISLPGVRDIHSIKVYDGTLYVTSTGTNEVFEVDLRSPEKISCRFKCPTTSSVPNVHLNDYLRHGGKEYILGHSNPFVPDGRKNGFIYSLTDHKVVVDKLEHAHTLLDIDGRLGVLDSARGRVVVTDGATASPWLQLHTGGILRGACESDDAMYVAMSSRRLFSRKKGLLQINVPDDHVVFGNEAFMSWLYRFDKRDLNAFTRVSLSEIAFEVYDLARVEHAPAPERLVPDAAAIRAQAWRQQFFWLSRRSVERAHEDEELLAAAPRPTPVSAPAGKRKPPTPASLPEPMAFWEVPIETPLTTEPAASPLRKEQGAEPLKRPIIAKPAEGQSPEANFQIVAKPGSSKTVIAFAGLAQLIGGMTTYNFMNSLKGTDANVIFVRDPRRSWFNGPIDGIGRNAAEISRTLSSLVSGLDTKDLYLLGTSSGGFAALAYAKMLNAKRILAFSPQTNIALDYLNSVGELRWIKLISRIKNPTFVDTSSLLSGIKELDCHLIVGRRMELDTVYAERLRDIKGMHLHYVDSGHNSAQFLRDTGKLSNILNQFVTGAPLKVD